MIVVITDGVDQGSRVTLKQAIEAAQKADAVIYSIDYSDPGAYGGGGSVWAAAATATSARCRKRPAGTCLQGRPASTPWSRSSRSFRTKCAASTPSATPPPTTPRTARYRQLEIKLGRKDLKAQARKGYYAVRGPVDSAYGSDHAAGGRRNSSPRPRSGGIGASPTRSILALDSAEYFGRRAAVRYSRSLVASSTGSSPAAEIRRANSNQEIGVPPPMWNTPGDLALHQVDGAGGQQRRIGRRGDMVLHHPDGIAARRAKRSISSTKLPRAVARPPGPNTPEVRTTRARSR